MFPWPCIAMFMRGIVRDPAPNDKNESCASATTEVYTASSKEQNGATIHHELTRRTSSSERKP